MVATLRPLQRTNGGRFSPLPSLQKVRPSRPAAPAAPSPSAIEKTAALRARYPEQFRLLDECRAFGFDKQASLMFARLDADRSPESRADWEAFVKEAGPLDVSKWFFDRGVGGVKRVGNLAGGLAGTAAGLIGTTGGVLGSGATRLGHQLGLNSEHAIAGADAFTGHMFGGLGASLQNVGGAFTPSGNYGARNALGNYLGEGAQMLENTGHGGQAAVARLAGGTGQLAAQMAAGGMAGKALQGVRGLSAIPGVQAAGNMARTPATPSSAWAAAKSLGGVAVDPLGAAANAGMPLARQLGGTASAALSRFAGTPAAQGVRAALTESPIGQLAGRAVAPVANAVSKASPQVAAAGRTVGDAVKSIPVVGKYVAPAAKLLGGATAAGAAYDAAAPAVARASEYGNSPMDQLKVWHEELSTLPQDQWLSPERQQRLHSTLTDLKQGMAEQGQDPEAFASSVIEQAQQNVASTPDVVAQVMKSPAAQEVAQQAQEAGSPDPFGTVMQAWQGMSAPERVLFGIGVGLPLLSMLNSAMGGESGLMQLVTSLFGLGTAGYLGASHGMFGQQAQQGADALSGWMQGFLGGKPDMAGQPAAELPVPEGVTPSGDAAAPNLGDIAADKQISPQEFQQIIGSPDLRAQLLAMPPEQLGPWLQTGLAGQPGLRAKLYALSWQGPAARFKALQQVIPGITAEESQKLFDAYALT